MSIIGDKIRAERQIKNWSQEDLKKRILQIFPNVMLSPKTISSWEIGRNNPKSYFCKVVFPRMFNKDKNFFVDNSIPPTPLNNKLKRFSAPRAGAPVPFTYGAIIRKLRTQKGWLQILAAEKLGVPIAKMSELEIGKAEKYFTPTFLDLCAKVFEVPVDSLKIDYGPAYPIKKKEVDTVSAVVDTADTIDHEEKRNTGIDFTNITLESIPLVPYNTPKPKDQFLEIISNIFSVITIHRKIQIIASIYDDLPDSVIDKLEKKEINNV